MNPYMVAPGIRFDEFVFSDPRRLAETALPKCGGVLVLMIGDPNWAPKHFQPLCFREFGNNSQQVLAYDPARLGRTLQAEALFVSILALPFSTAAERCEIRDKLVRAYNPFCQTGGSPVLQSELVHKLDQLERKNEEQTLQVRLLLASINRLFEPQPEPRRRPIGFLPQPLATE
jgi:hypothetical protein